MIKHYVTKLYPGAIVSESSDEEVKSRDPKLVDYDRAFAFHFWDRTESEIDGELLIGPKKNKSGTYYPGGKVKDQSQCDGILLQNMIGNRWNHVVVTRLGNTQPFEDGDVIL